MLLLQFGSFDLSAGNFGDGDPLRVCLRDFGLSLFSFAISCGCLVFFPRCDGGKS